MALSFAACNPKQQRWDYVVYVSMFLEGKYNMHSLGLVALDHVEDGGVDAENRSD